MNAALKLPLEDTTGSKGKGKGGGGGGSEAADTIATNETIKVLHALGEGEASLFTGDGQSIFINNTPLNNPDGSENFPGTVWEFLPGSLSQGLMTNPAFPGASNVFAVGAQILSTAPQIYSVTQAVIDYALITIQLPNGLMSTDSKGNINGNTVQLQFDVKPHSGSTWTTVASPTITGVASTEIRQQYQVNNPDPGSLWDIRVSRLTADNSTDVSHNETYLFSVEEVEKIQLTYDGIILLGLVLNAAVIGGENASIPTISIMLEPGPITIPSNYNPTTLAYTGVWDGTFTTGVTDNPAWVLYEMLTNPRYGMYLYGITAADINPYSFYNAAVFNDQLVPDGLGGSGTEPRFTFNGIIQNRQTALVALQQVAGMMNASLSYVDGLITLIQDRPTASQYFINKARVIGDDPATPQYFSYGGNEDTDRYTTINVTWTNAADIQYLPKISSVQDATMLTRYGYQPYDLTAFGATTEGQALRAGRYWIYNSCYNTGTVTFKMGREGFNSQVDDVFDIYDDDRMGRYSSGRIVSATTNTVTLDRAVTIDPTVTTTLAIFDQNGTYETYTVANTAGTYSTLTITGTFATVPTKYSPFGIASPNVEPSTWKITDIAFDSDDKTFTIQAQQYSSANYTYVDSGYTVPTPVYTLPVLVVPIAPTNLSTTATQFIDPVDSLLVRGVIVEWDRPTQQNVSYVLKWRKDNGNYVQVPPFVNNSYVLDDIVSGTYDFLVTSNNVAGNSSAAASISYTLDTSGGGTSATLSEITNLEVSGGGTTWTGVDLTFDFTNPSANQGLLKDFVVTLKNSGDTVLRTVVCDPVLGGAEQSYIYHFADNVADGGGTPNRTIVVTVQGRDQLNNVTPGITATLSNATPAIPNNIAATPSLQACTVQWDPDTDVDLAGYIIWWSTTNGFTPSSGNATDTNATIVNFNGLVKNTTYYYRVAAYDVFGKDLSGAGLNVSGQLSTTTPSMVGVPSGSTLPASGNLEGDTFYNTSDGHLYQYTSGAWALVSGDLVANSVTAIKLNSVIGSFTSTMTSVLDAVQANITDLSSVSATLGTITGTSNITLTTSSWIKGGQTGYNTGSGFFLGYDGGAYKFSVGNSSGNHLSWDGSTLTISGGAVSGAVASASSVPAAGVGAGNLGSGVIALQVNGGGTFSGALSAASGTFAGSLSAATGTFSGTLTVAAVDAVNTINVAGQAITVPQATQSTGSTGAVVYFTVDSTMIPPGQSTANVEVTATMVAPTSAYNTSKYFDLFIASGVVNMASTTSTTYSYTYYVPEYTYPSTTPTGYAGPFTGTQTVTTSPWNTAGNVIDTIFYYGGPASATVLQQFGVGTYTIAVYDRTGTDGWSTNYSSMNLNVQIAKR